MRRRIALLCAALLAVGTSAGAHAMPPRGEPDTPIYCDYGHLSGSSTWLDPGIGVTPANNHYVITFDADCPAYGPAYGTLRDASGNVPPEQSDDAGRYHLRLEGDSVDTCVHGESFNGVLSGTGPEGSVSGAFRYHRENAHLWITGVMVSGGETHRITLWLDLVPFVAQAPPQVPPAPADLVTAAQQWLASASPDFTAVCAVRPVRAAPIIGHGVIRDPDDGWDVLWDTADLAVFTAGGLQDADAPKAPVFEGRKCSFNSTTDVTREPGWQTGQISGGPFYSGAAGSLRCSIHVNNDVHNGAYALVLSARASNGVVAIPPGPISFKATAADDVAVCTEWLPDFGPAQYWVGGNPVAGNLGHWSTDPNSTCGIAVAVEPIDPECSIFKAVDNRLGTPLAEIWQDCGPYDPII